MFSCVAFVWRSGGKLKTKNAGEAISCHFAKRLKSKNYLNYSYAYLKLFQRRKSPFIFSLKCL